MSKWTDDRVELLRRLWAEGHSASRIAARLGGVTRNAVVGKVHRLGLSGRKTLARKQETRPRRRSNGMRAFAPRNLWPSAKPALPREPYTPPPAPVIPPHQRKSLQDLTETCCRWPIGDPKDDPDFGFCPAKAVPGLPYCEAHASIAYQMPPLRVLERLAAARQDQDLVTVGG